MKLKIGLLALAFIIVTPIHAASPIAVCRHLPENFAKKKLTLIELTDIALSCNPSTYIAWAQTKSSLANLGIAKSAYWPQIALGFNWDSTVARASTGRANITPPNPTYNYVYGPSISLGYLLWDFGVTDQKVKAAKYQSYAALFNQNYIFQQIIIQVEQSYYQFLGQKELIAVYKDSIQENLKNLKTAKALRKQGIATIGDVYQAESSLSQAKLTLQQAEGQLKILQGELATNLGIPIASHLHLEPLSSHIATKHTMRSIHKLITSAKQTRPDLLAAESQVTAAEAQLSATKRAALPTFNITMVSQPSYSPHTQVRAYNSSAMLTLSMPIFTGFAQKYALRAAEAQQAQAQSQKEQLNQKVDSDVWQAYYNVETAVKTITTSETLLKSSLQSARQAFGQYKAGVGNILTVLTTQVVAENARAQVIQAKLNWYSSVAQLSSAMGQLSITPTGQKS